MILGLILARGGSKRIPRKNIRELGGIPLIAWTIGQALQVEALSKVVVSSENQEILKIAKAWGAEPLMRPEEMASDEAPPYPAILHAIDIFRPRHVCLMLPTSPFRDARDTQACIDLAMRGLTPAAATAKAGATVPNGAVYVGRTDWLKAGGNFDGSDVLHCMMPPYRSLDINTEDDWAEAEQTVKMFEKVYSEREYWLSDEPDDCMTKEDIEIARGSVAFKKMERQFAFLRKIAK